MPNSYSKCAGSDRTATLGQLNAASIALKAKEDADAAAKKQAEFDAVQQTNFDTRKIYCSGYGETNECEQSSSDGAVGSKGIVCVEPDE